MVGEADDGGIAGVLKECLEAGKTHRIRHPNGIWPIGIVFDDEDGVLGAEVGGAQGAEQGWFIFYIMEGVGHENAVEIEGREILFDEVGFFWLDGDLIGSQLGPDGGFAVDGVDGAAGGQEAGEGDGEKAGATTEVGPAGGVGELDGGG